MQLFLPCMLPHTPRCNEFDWRGPECKYELPKWWHGDIIWGWGRYSSCACFRRWCHCCRKTACRKVLSIYGTYMCMSKISHVFLHICATGRLTQSLIAITEGIWRQVKNSSQSKSNLHQCKSLRAQRIVPQERNTFSPLNRWAPFVFFPGLELLTLFFQEMDKGNNTKKKQKRGPDNPKCQRLHSCQFHFERSDPLLLDHAEWRQLANSKCKRAGNASVWSASQLNGFLALSKARGLNRRARLPQAWHHASKTSQKLVDATPFIPTAFLPLIVCPFFTVRAFSQVALK